MLSFKIILLEPRRMLSLHLVLIPVIMFLINPEKDMTSDVITVCQFLAHINIKTITHALAANLLCQKFITLFIRLAKLHLIAVT